MVDSVHYWSRPYTEHNISQPLTTESNIGVARSTSGGHIRCYRVTNFNKTKSMHKKFVQKYELREHMNIYHHLKFEVEQIFLQEERKEKFAHQ